jgi:hypothetical protein
MPHILFRCPRTGMNVQHWIAEDAAQDAEKSYYDAVTCPICLRLHFVNRMTGKTLGDKDKAD